MPRIANMSGASAQEGGERRAGHLPEPSRISALPAPPAPGSAGSGGGASDAERAIEILRGRIDEEFRISERYDAKGRQLFTVAAGFYAAVQAVAFAAFGTEHLASEARLAVLVCAFGAGLVLIVVGQRLANAEAPLKEADIPPEDLVAWLESEETEEQVLLRQVGALATVAKSRAAKNAERKTTFEAIDVAVRWSLIASGVELLLALTVRL
jgi:hypothetical protein